MAKLRVVGGRPLHGTIRASGSKNATVGAIPAALLARGPSRLENVPAIGDVHVFIDILRELGAEIHWRGPGVLEINPNGFRSWKAPYDLVKRLRASYYLLGVLLARFGQAEVALPGGCDIGVRPVDLHLKGFRALGAEVSLEYGVVKARADKLRGATIYLDDASVGATINIMLVACVAEGTTVIENAAREPHVADAANYLNAMGARIHGAGTEFIRIQGVPHLVGAEHAIIPDEVEVGTYMMAAVATGGDISIENAIAKHLEAVAAKLRETGAEVETNGDWIRVKGPGRPRAANVRTLRYPGFPTDLQQPYVSVAALAEGVSVVHETIYENRFAFVSELLRMGARIKVEGRTAIVQGVDKLLGAPVRARNDLRGGAALVVAALAAEGESEIDDLQYIERGYEHLDEKLRALGAEVTRLP
ncbi:MAG: UDP-N-acetylglucosamine 1-carboxyvinyltransferase [Bacillota bacterium]|nr:UDP-N-acetylglucosamine 1-carboxyvinyltransferase [Bacillota bacterium]